jgi:alginate O-acetyltransferase complex protein AlgI
LLFTGAPFLLVFLPLTLVVYWVAPRSWRLPVLLAASYAFYLASTPAYGALLALSTVVNYRLARALPASGRPRRVLAAGVAFNLGVLAFFKYAGLLSSSGADVAGALGLGNGGWDGLRIVLPLAISFFTFEMISVLVDVHRGKARVGGFLPFATYKAFFPKLLAGPITRYGELVPQLEAAPDLDAGRFRRGMGLFALGMLKKLALANNLALVADAVFEHPGTTSAAVTLAGILAFGLQILFDFSAYTDMARGAALMLGYELPRNFLLPYAASSPRDFWRRWHMSLSRWLRDYLYIPLGGNRKGPVRTRLNLLVTMTLGGLWHGAAWHFAAWGLGHGLLLAGDRRRPRRSWTAPLAWVGTLVAVLALWVPFRASSLADAVDVYRSLGHFSLAQRSFGLGEATPLWGSRASAALVIVLLLAAYACFPLADALRTRWAGRLAGSWSERAAALMPATVVCWTLALLLAPTAARPFIYFRF